jgi:protein-L-isoaspartate O-methyltransferase
MRRRRLLGALAAAPLFLARAARGEAGSASVLMDGGPYVPTPQPVVARMLDLAEVQVGDVLFDLGSGDGRLVVEAARRGARAIGIERDAELVRRAQAAAAAAGVSDRAEFRQGDLFEADLRAASVVTLYLLPQLLERLAPKLLAELRPGARVVSHDFPLAAWPAVRVLEFDSPEKAEIVFVSATSLFLYVMTPAAGASFRR